MATEGGTEEPSASVAPTCEGYRVEQVGEWRDWSRRIVRGFRRLNFWLAIALPFIYTPVLVIGVPTELGLTGVGGLIVLNAVAAILGHHVE